MPFQLKSKVVISTDGTEIYAEAVGNPTKPHIVFVLGFSLCAAVFDRIFLDAEFQESYYLVRSLFHLHILVVFSYPV